MAESAGNMPRHACSSAPQALESTAASGGRSEGMRTAAGTRVVEIGSVTSMAGAMRVFGLLVMVVVPGGLLVLAAFVLARAWANAARLEQGTARRRLVRAVAQVRWRDVWTSAKQTL